MWYTCKCGKIKKEFPREEKWIDERRVLDEVINMCTNCKPISRDGVDDLPVKA